uniref:Uncharacterized protein n=1 Tax=Anopheles atroparvus TaxID=41427 RepID=A0A182IUQ4_ANOAO
MAINRYLPALKSWIELVSCFPVRRRSLSFPPFGSYARMWRSWCFDSLAMAFSISAMPPGSRIAFVETFVCAPAPFQSPCIGLGSRVATIWKKRGQQGVSTNGCTAAVEATYTKLFRHAVQQEAGHPQVVPDLDALARSHLVLPLGRHHLGVGAAQLHARVQTGAVVCVDDVARVHLIRTHAAVVRTLRSWEAVLRPAERTTVHVQQRVLLLDAKPRVLVAGQLAHLQARLALVRLGRPTIVTVRLAQHQDVVAASERIAVDRDRVQVHVRVGALRLGEGVRDSSLLPLGDWGMKSSVRSLQRTFSPVPSIQMYVACILPSGIGNDMSAVMHIRCSKYAAAGRSTMRPRAFGALHLTPFAILVVGPD